MLYIKRRKHGYMLVCPATVTNQVNDLGLVMPAGLIAIRQNKPSEPELICGLDQRSNAALRKVNQPYALADQGESQDF